MYDEPFWESLNQVLNPEYEYHFYEKKFAQLEEKLNQIGYYPVASTVSGLARMIIASTAFYAEIYAIIPFTLAYNLFTKEPRDVLYAPLKQCSYLLHAGANAIRGIVEIIPLAGNIATYGYDRYVGRIKYLAENR